MIVKRSKIPTILGIILLLAATFAGVFFINYRQIFRIGAEGESEPNDIRISNVTDTSLTVSWTTDKESVGFVIWDKSPTSPDEKGYTHSFNFAGLNPNTTYEYKINSNGAGFDNNGIPWQAKTAANPQVEENPQLVSGSVLTATGQAVKNALVYANVEGSLYSTLTSASGNFVFQLFGINPTSSLIEIFVQAGPQGVSSAQIYAQAAKPVPPMILGNTHDFRNLAPSTSDGLPGADLSLPEDINQESKFSILDVGTPPSQATITLESIDEGEVVTSEQPEFFGEGPAGTQLTITVESENPVTDNVNIGTSGSWSWTPPEGLSPGTHKITINWKDFSGITRSLTRTFVVQAGEAPAFEASESATTTTPTPTVKPTATSTPKATVTPTATSTASGQPVPETGSLTPTFLLSIMGIAVMLFSFIVWKNAESI